VFVEVRSRRGAAFGGAAASVGATQQRSLVLAARHDVSRLTALPPCRLDGVAIEGQGSAARIEWLRGAFDTS
jgi:putative endonuclease